MKKRMRYQNDFIDRRHKIELFCHISVTFTILVKEKIAFLVVADCR